jgi:hypothetical protein
MATAEKQPNSNGRARGGKFAKGNLLGFKPGQSGNPAGRPKYTVVSEALRAQLAEKMPDAGEETFAEALARALIDKALGGDVLAAREILDRVEGKPRQTLDVGMTVNDWRAVARQNGLSLDDVRREAQLLLSESADDPGGDEGGRAA